MDDRATAAIEGERRAREPCDTIEARHKESLALTERLHSIDREALRTENASMKAALLLAYTALREIERNTERRTIWELAAGGMAAAKPYIDPETLEEDKS